MGQCMSRKAAGAFAASAAAAHSKPTKMQKHGQIQSPGDDDKDLSRKQSLHTKGVSTSFGFKRRPTTAPSIASNSNAARRLANTDIIDRNGNGNSDTEPLTTNIAPTARSTPRLMPPKKEGIATRVNRFGFRQPQGNRLHKVSDLNNAPAELCNNNVAKVKSNQAKVKGVAVDSNKNRMAKPPQVKVRDSLKTNFSEGVFFRPRSLCCSPRNCPVRSRSESSRQKRQKLWRTTAKRALITKITPPRKALSRKIRELAVKSAPTWYPEWNV
jgi:hypothetical protein